MRIAIVAGGRTPERDISLRGGRRMTLSLGELGHEAWLVDPAEVPLVQALSERRPDLCWLALHGKEGEDGTVQRLLDLLEIPYTGTAAFDCEVAFDQNVFKLTTPSEYLRMFPTQQVTQPSASSWGAKGYWEVWLEGSNDWIYRHLHEGAQHAHQQTDQHRQTPSRG